MFLQDDAGFWKVPFGKCWIVFCARRLPISWRVLFCSCMCCRSCCCRVILSVQRKIIDCQVRVYIRICVKVSVYRYLAVRYHVLVASHVSRLTYQFACQVRKYWRTILGKSVQIIYQNESCLITLTACIVGSNTVLYSVHFLPELFNVSCTSALSRRTCV